MKFTPQEKNILRALGRSSNGRGLISILERAKEVYSSVDDIKEGGDYGAQVEGRKLFKIFADDFITELNSKEPRNVDIEAEDFT